MWLQKVRFSVFIPVIMAGCAHPVTRAHWYRCEDVCQEQGGLREACDGLMHGPACHCENDKVIKLNDTSTIPVAPPVESGPEGSEAASEAAGAEEGDSPADMN